MLNKITKELNKQYLFDVLLMDETGELFLYNDFDCERSKDIYEWFEVDSMKQEKIKLFGKEFYQPRLIRFEGDKGVNYKYSNQIYVAEDWGVKSKEILKKINEITPQPFNSVLMNLYRDGNDSMGLHADNEPELGVTPTIASVSYGAERSIWFKENNGNRKIKVSLKHGSLLIMTGNLQSNWKHEVKKSKKVDSPRLNFTFRMIV